MRKLITLLIVLISASTINSFAIELSKNISGLDLPANPLVAPEGKPVKLPKLNATAPMYILFDNLDPQISDQISNYIDLFYYDIYKTYPRQEYNYYDLMVRAPYSDATLSQYNLTDFDVAIFPLGSYPLNVATNGGGIKVIDKIKEMLNAGKRVMIMGRAWSTWAFYNDPQLAQGKDPVVIDFLTNTLGIDGTKSGPVAISDGTNPYPFHVSGIETDPVQKGYDYYGNIAYGRNVPPQPPLVYRGTMDVFSLKTDAPSDGYAYLDKVGKTDGDPNVNPGFWVGAKSQVGDGRIAIWSIMPDNIAGPEVNFFIYTERFAMDWFTKDLFKAGPWLELEAMSLNFGESMLDVQKVQEVRFRNFGKQPLTITSIFWNGWEENAFKFVDGSKPGVLQPGEVRTLQVGFTPDQERDYEDQIFIESDAINGATQSIAVKGIGGKDAPTGPEIGVQAAAFDYGLIEIPTSKVKDIFFSSVGTDNVIVNNIEFVTNDDKAFTFPVTMNFPQTVKPGTNYTFAVKFTPISYGKTYTASLKITSNAKKNGVAYLNLIGKSKSSSIGPSISSSASQDTVDFGHVNPNEKKNLEFTIISSGAEDLRLNSYYIKDDNDVFIIADTCFKNMPIVLPPGKVYNVPVSFQPWVSGDIYYAKLGIFTNATNPGGNNFVVNFKGIGDDKVSVKDEASNIVGTLKLRAFPNPTGGNFTLEVTSKETFLNSSLNIYNLEGKVVSTIFHGNIISGTTSYQLNNDLLPSGKYFIGVQTATESVMLPFMIIK